MSDNFKTINGHDCRLDDEGNIDLPSGEVIKFEPNKKTMTWYDIDGGIKGVFADSPDYHEWKARRDELMSYVDEFDADEQVSAEEEIASIIFNATERLEDDTNAVMGTLTEQDCGDLGRQLLKHILWKFRPDMFVGGSRDEMYKMMLGGYCPTPPVTNPPKTCKKCGSNLKPDGRCKDETCPYSDRQQHESYTEG